MTSIRRFAKNIENRKDLVKKISSITGIASRYTGMPRAAYEIGAFTVEKDGTLAVTVNEEGGNEGGVILALKADGMIGEEIIMTAPTSTETTETTDEQTASEAATTAMASEVTHSDEEADNDPAYSSVEDIDEAGQTDSSVEDTERGQSAIAEFVPVNDDDDFSSIGIEDWEPQAEPPEQTDEEDAQTEPSNQTAQITQASELQQPVTEEPQSSIEELDEQEIEPQQYAQYADLEELESWEEPQNLPEDETVADNNESDGEQDGEAIDNSDEAADSDEADSEDDQSLAISFPIHQHTPTSIINLVCMIHSRGPLLSKATGGHFSASMELANALLDHGTFSKNRDVVNFINNYISAGKSPTDSSDKHAGETADNSGALIGLTFDEDEWRVVFDGFPASLDPAHIMTFTNLATAMNKMAQRQKRIQAKTVNDSNEKYALRIWLVRLDMNGDEHKEDRKILMENLTGHTAFRTEADKEKWIARQNAKKRKMHVAFERAVASTEQVVSEVIEQATTTTAITELTATTVTEPTETVQAAS